MSNEGFFTERDVAEVVEAAVLDVLNARVDPTVVQYSPDDVVGVVDMDSSRLTAVIYATVLRVLSQSALVEARFGIKTNGARHDYAAILAESKVERKLHEAPEEGSNPKGKALAIDYASGRAVVGQLMASVNGKDTPLLLSLLHSFLRGWVDSEPKTKLRVAEFVAQAVKGYNTTSDKSANSPIVNAKLIALSLLASVDRSVEVAEHVERLSVKTALRFVRSNDASMDTIERWAFVDHLVERLGDVFSDLLSSTRVRVESKPALKPQAVLKTPAPSPQAVFKRDKSGPISIEALKAPALPEGLRLGTGKEKAAIPTEAAIMVKFLRETGHSVRLDHEGNLDLVALRGSGIDSEILESVKRGRKALEAFLLEEATKPVEGPKEPVEEVMKRAIKSQEWFRDQIEKERGEEISAGSPGIPNVSVKTEKPRAEKTAVPTIAKPAGVFETVSIKKVGGAFVWEDLATRTRVSDLRMDPEGTAGRIVGALLRAREVFPGSMVPTGLLRELVVHPPQADGSDKRQGWLSSAIAKLVKRGWPIAAVRESQDSEFGKLIGYVLQGAPPK